MNSAAPICRNQGATGSGSGVITNNMFMTNSHAFVANHRQDQSLLAQNVFFLNGDAIIAQASFLNVIGNLLVGNSTHICQEYIQEGFIGCNVITIDDPGFVAPGALDSDCGPTRKPRATAASATSTRLRPIPEPSAARSATGRTDRPRAAVDEASEAEIRRAAPWPRHSRTRGSRDRSPVCRRRAGGHRLPPRLLELRCRQR